jgi:PBP1b-binding outer membrane lipoprotein LpoB
MKSINLYLLSAALICVFIISCTVPIEDVGKVPERVPEKSVKMNIKAIALIPFSSEEGIPPEKEGFLTSALHNELLSKIKKVAIISLDNSISEFEDVRKKNPNLTYEEAAIKAGKNLGADAVLIGNIFVYREREGAELSIVSPASVAFGVQLMNTADGEVVWDTYFTETQKPLFENVAEVGKFFKRKGKWVTADEIATEGIHEVADNLSKFLEQK